MMITTMKNSQGSSLNTEQVKGRSRVLVHEKEAAMRGRDVSSAGTAFGGALGRDGAVNEVLSQEDDKGNPLDHETSRSIVNRPSLHWVGKPP